MVDIQEEIDERGILLNHVGIKNLRYPIRVLEKSSAYQNSVASINMFVELDEKKRGIHMSRLIELLHEWNSTVSYETLKTLLRRMKESLESEQAYIEMNFPFFVKKCAPVTNKEGLVDYEYYIAGRLDKNDNYELIFKVNVPITSVCPCSKAISDDGAHNQRGEVSITVKTNGELYIEKIIEIAENAASSSVFSILKRPDEKYVTENGFNNPKFVEDIIRDVAISLKQVDYISWFDVSVENFESIHNHNAFARIIHV